MKTKRGLAAAAILVIAVVALWLLFHSKTPAPPAVALSDTVSSDVARANSATAAIVASANTDSTAAGVDSSSVQIPPETLAAKAGQLLPESSGAPEVPPETALQNVQRAVRKYGEMFGGNPVGTNREITSQLGGNNPKHLNFITTEAGMRVNGEGELVDAWGTPYFFHQLSGSEMEIHSAGPDKVMWTPDDLVAK